MWQKSLWVLIIMCTTWKVTGSNPKATFWKTQTKGTNYFNQIPNQQWFAAAQDLGVQWVRLTYEKWKSEQTDFLMGNADDYQGLVTQDLIMLRQALDWAHQHQLKVVIAPLGLPGNRWFQNNNQQRDLRLWQDFNYWKQAAQFWQDLASELKEHPAVVAYNILNEPTPEMGTGLQEHSTAKDILAWSQKFKGTPHDLPAFYEKVIVAIREVDRKTPIMLDSGWYAQPAAFSHWPILKDPHLLFAVHMYEPYAFTNRKNFVNQKNYQYPGKIPFAGNELEWNQQKIAEYFSPFLTWAQEHGIEKHRLVVSEFGCYRRNEGCEAYFRDLLEVLNNESLHWAFYSFREDEWDGYDYELGTNKPNWAYWQAKEQGTTASLSHKPNTLFNVIAKEFAKK